MMKSYRGITVNLPKGYDVPVTFVIKARKL